MKNFFKFLGIISMVLVIGFSMAGCKSDDDGDPDPGPGPDSATLTWPAEFMTRDATSGKIGEWTSTANGGVTFNNSSSGLMLNSSSTYYKLTSISGKTIKVKLLDGSGNPTGNEITLCTGYTRTGEGEIGTLTLTGFDSDFANFTSLTGKKGNGGQTGGDPLIGKWYGENGASFSVVIFEFKSGGKVVSSGTEMDYVYDASAGTLTLSMMGYTFNTYTNVTLNGDTLTITSDGKTDTLKKH
jgi:hypothetical protein